MGRARGEAWARGSAYAGPLFHVTTAAAAEEIRRTGFDLSFRAGGRAWGNGVYAATDATTVVFYLAQLGAAGVVLELRAKVRRILVAPVRTRSGQLPMLQVLGLVDDGLARFVDAGLREPDRAAALTRVLREAGYDALEIREPAPSGPIGGNQLVVFDPRRIVVVMDDDRA